MKALTCTKCGGQINPHTHKCDFCGTYYHEETTYEIVHERDDFQTIAAHVEVPYYGALRGKESGEILKSIAESDSHYAIDLLREKIANAIIPFMDIDVGMPDPRSSCIPIMGRVRVKRLEHDKVHYR